MNAALKERIEKMKEARGNLGDIDGNGNLIEVGNEEIRDSGLVAQTGTDNPWGNTTQGRALEYLGKGLKPGQVATILGISPGLVSQFLSDETFKLAVEDRLAVRSLAVQKRNERYDMLEDKIVDQLEKNISFIYKPMEMVAALKAINGLERRQQDSVDQGSGLDKKVVVLQLPAFMLTNVTNVQISADSQIVEVNGEEMRTMGTTNVGKLLEKHREAKKNAEVVSELDSRIFE